MKKVGLCLVAGLLIAGLALVGCKKGGSQTDDQSGKMTIAFSQMEMNNAWRVAETKSIQDEAQARGITLIYTDAQGDTAKQVSDVEDIIAKKPDVILLAPREYEGLAPALAAAKKANVPVILIDRDAAGTAGVDYKALISADFIWEGQQCAQVLVSRFGTTQPVNVVQITGTPGSSVAIDRQKGFEDELAKYPNFKIISTQNGEFTRSIAQKAMENIIQSQGSNINAVYGHDDECAIGAIQALKAAGMKPGTDIAVVGVGGFKDAAVLIENKEMDATVLCSPFFGPTAFDACEKLLSGETLPTYIQNPGKIIDASNVSAYMPDAF
jgi:ribose transport system substrate-binding protein